MTMYRLTWEMVSPHKLWKYCNSDPTYYSNVTQTVPNSLIPDEDWHKVVKETDDPWDQYHTLKEWADSDKEFVRNVRLEKRVNEPVWEPVEGGSNDH